MNSQKKEDNQLTSNGEEAQNDDHVAERVREAFQSRFAANNNAGRQRDKEVGGHPEQAHARDQQINPIAFALPEAAHRVGEHFQQNLECEKISPYVPSTCLDSKKHVQHGGQCGHNVEEFVLLLLFLHIPRQNQRCRVQDHQRGEELIEGAAHCQLVQRTPKCGRFGRFWWNVQRLCHLQTRLQIVPTPLVHRQQGGSLMRREKMAFSREKIISIFLPRENYFHFFCDAPDSPCNLQSQHQRTASAQSCTQ